ncbi:MAG: sigma factor-like helix-turn-helix DNA-binding protein [Gemmatimonadales bacterium]
MQQQVLIKTRQMQVVEHRLGKAIEVYIRERYEAGATQAEIAEELGLTFSTVSRWMAQLGIVARLTGTRAKVAIP